MPEINIVITTDGLGHPRPTAVTIKTSVSPLGKEDTVQEVIAAAGAVGKFFQSCNVVDLGGKAKNTELRICLRCGVTRTDDLPSNICGSCADELRGDVPKEE